MVIEMADFGADVLISSDHNFVVETIACELCVIWVEIDHHLSKRFSSILIAIILGVVVSVALLVIKFLKE